MAVAIIRNPLHVLHGSITRKTIVALTAGTDIDIIIEGRENQTCEVRKRQTEPSSGTQIPSGGSAWYI